jgi:hypothetical protein
MTTTSTADADQNASPVASSVDANRSAPADPSRGLDFSDFTILLSRQRSGTNAFRSALETHPDIFCFNEVFNVRDVDSEDEILRNTNFFAFVEAYRTEDFRRTLPGNHEQLFLDFLEYLRCFSPKARMVVDVKSNTLHFLERPWAPITADPYLLELIVSHRLRVLHLTRRNYLRYALSVTKAWRSGRYSVITGEDRPADTQITLGPGWLMKTLDTCFEEDEALARYFDSYPLYRSYDYSKVFRTSTEELAAEVRQELAAWLGVSDSFGRVEYFQKQSSLPLSETIANFDEVVDLLTNTRYEYCLEDEPIYRTRVDDSQHKAR